MLAIFPEYCFVLYCFVLLYDAKTFPQSTSKRGMLTFSITSRRYYTDILPISDESMQQKELCDTANFDEYHHSLERREERQNLGDVRVRFT